ncbi:MAG: hypothetical protein VXW15_13325 [Bdellovibrionota bacterium]|nr:hypothetical protein [Bdellovibrionota bacterium]
MKGMFNHLGNQLKNRLFNTTLLDDSDPELDHLRRLRRLRRFMGNISAEEGRSVELEIEELSLKFGYPPQQITQLLEWIIEGQKSDPLLYKDNLRMALKLAKTLGRSRCTSLTKKDIGELIPPLLH